MKLIEQSSLDNTNQKITPINYSDEELRLISKQNIFFLILLRLINDIITPEGIEIETLATQISEHIPRTLKDFSPFLELLEIAQIHHAY